MLFLIARNKRSIESLRPIEMEWSAVYLVADAQKLVNRFPLNLCRPSSAVQRNAHEIRLVRLSRPQPCWFRSLSSKNSEQTQQINWRCVHICLIISSSLSVHQIMRHQRFCSWNSNYSRKAITLSFSNLKSLWRWNAKIIINDCQGRLRYLQSYLNSNNFLISRVSVRMNVMNFQCFIAVEFRVKINCFKFERERKNIKENMYSQIRTATNSNEIQNGTPSSVSSTWFQYENKNRFAAYLWIHIQMERKRNWIMNLTWFFFTLPREKSVLLFLSSRIFIFNIQLSMLFSFRGCVYRLTSVDSSRRMKLMAQGWHHSKIKHSNMDEIESDNSTNETKETPFSLYFSCNFIHLRWPHGHANCNWQTNRLQLWMRRPHRKCSAMTKFIG